MFFFPLDYIDLDKCLALCGGLAVAFGVYIHGMAYYFTRLSLNYNILMIMDNNALRPHNVVSQSRCAPRNIEEKPNSDSTGLF